MRPCLYCVVLFPLYQEGIYECLYIFRNFSDAAWLSTRAMYARERKCVALIPVTEITVAIAATRNVLQWGCQEKVRTRLQMGRYISDSSSLFL